jgi:hypothetical protein
MNRRKHLLLAGTLLVLFAWMTMGVAGCGGTTTLIRSDPPINGMESSVKYTIDSTLNGASETNQSVYQGINGTSPLPLLTTTFGRGASSKTETVQATREDGTAVNVLGMNKRTINFGLTAFLTSELATYDMRDSKNDRVCGAKVRMTYQPNIAQQIFGAGLGSGWDVLWYYSVPCANTPEAPLDLANAKLTALVIDQVLNVRMTGKPLIWNRGHSVTIVGGKPTTLPGGWWKSNAMILNVATPMIKGLISDLNQKDNSWLQFTPGGPFAASKLVYSAGDADTYLTFKRVFLNRQSDYVVHFRGSPSEPWKIVVVHPQYNIEWNDLSQQWHALKSQAFPNIDDKIDQKTGLPKDFTDATVKEIETEGCQNCPNAGLEQILIRDGNSGRPLYAMTVRGYLGAKSSLVMFGGIPDLSLDSALNQAEAHRQRQGFDTTNHVLGYKTNGCPIQRDPDGKISDQQMTSDQCVKFLREGSLWDMLTQDPSKFGFDVVGQFQVRDNSTWHSQCDSDGTNCINVADDTKLDASYLFSTAGPKLQQAWTVMQLLGEVGVRTLGLSYTSGPGQGSGLLFGMEQPMMYQQYFSGISNPEMVFAFDARALQLPQTLAAAGQVLYGNQG